ncbi:aspartate aminotransferase family protein [Virgibacillus byunsanensis]|uniref:Aspartate aminotransferase family protein n=1 Tax=Virgibacillus byunsanensis TaxID=570945 RepID=A0ABW3LM01_9BACI
MGKEVIKINISKEDDHVFHRNLNLEYPIIDRAEGVYLYESSGKKFIDGCSGAVAANLGHGVTQITDAMNQQAKKAAFVHSLRFETEVLYKLSKEIIDLAPKNFSKVFYTCSGSEANESAIKLVHQYHKDRGNEFKRLIVGRWQSYHGNTLGTLSIGGDLKRRTSFSALLYEHPHINSPITDNEDMSLTNYIDELESLIKNYGAENIGAIICEPIVGSQQGAMVPPYEYFKRIKDICKKNDLLLIIDEVMTGFGRTGKNFAIEYFDVIPDIITFGKGVTGGYAPLGGIIVHNDIVKAILENSNGIFKHGFTYSGHPVLVATGLAAINYYKSNDILYNCNIQSEYLLKGLNQIYDKYKMIKSINGKGLLIGLEFVPNRDHDKDFKASEKVSERLNQISMENGLVLYPGSGAKKGKLGQHIIIAPPLTVNNTEIDEILEILDKSLLKLQKEINYN